jgi:hypothetical protein
MFLLLRSGHPIPIQKLGYKIFPLTNSGMFVEEGCVSIPIFKISHSVTQSGHGPFKRCETQTEVLGVDDAASIRRAAVGAGRREP